MAKNMVTNVVPQNLALEAATVAVRFSFEGCPTIAGHFMALAHTIARAAEAAPPHSCNGSCVLTMDEDERQDLARWAHNITRETLTNPTILRAARLVRDWMQDERVLSAAVLSAVDDVFYV